jgi:heptosyltransferase-2
MTTSLVVQTSYLGDVVLTTPLIAELAKRGPVDVLATPTGARALANNPAIRTLTPYDKRDTYGAAIHLWRTVLRIRVGRPYDAVYLAQGSFRSGLIAMMTGAKERIGFATSAASALYTRKVEYRADRHHSERLWWLSMSDCADPPTPEQLAIRLFPSDEDRAEVDRLLADNGLAGEDFIALAPGSAWGSKRWPYFDELAARVSRDHKLVIVGSGADCDIAAQIIERVGPERCVDACGKLKILASAELIGRARAIVTNDSAPEHLASAMGTPTLALFGPTVPDFGFGPLAPRRIIAGVTGLDCRPCHRHGPKRCPLGHWRCMRELDVDDVTRMLGSLLETSVAA